MTPEETKETQDMQNLNPQITDVEIGVRTLRKIKLYPLSVGDQMKMTAMIASTVSTFLVLCVDFSCTAFNFSIWDISLTIAEITISFYVDFHCGSHLSVSPV